MPEQVLACRLCRGLSSLFMNMQDEAAKTLLAAQLGINWLAISGHLLPLLVHLIQHAGPIQLPANEPLVVLLANASQA